MRIWLFVLLLQGPAVLADVYRWVDADGNVVYSQVPPPPGVEAERMTLEPPPAPAPVQERGTAEQSGEKAPPPAASGKTTLDPATRRAYCEKALNNLELLDNAVPGMPFVTEEGKLVRFDKEELERRRARALKAREAYCKD